MLKVGITGGIGSGKSTVCKIFELLGIPVYYADDEAKKLYNSNPDLKQNIISHFGQNVYPNDVFDKNVMKEIVFNDPEKLNLLNSLVHPIVKAETASWMKSQTAPYAIKEAALLIESGSHLQLDEIIYIESPEVLRMQRVMQRDHLNALQVQQRMNGQMPEAEKKKFATLTIVNDDKQLLIPQVLSLHELLLKKISS